MRAPVAGLRTRTAAPGWRARGHCWRPPGRDGAARRALQTAHRRLHRGRRSHAPGPAGLHNQRGQLLRQHGPVRRRPTGAAGCGAGRPRPQPAGPGPYAVRAPVLRHPRRGVRRARRRGQLLPALQHLRLRPSGRPARAFRVMFRSPSGCPRRPCAPAARAHTPMSLLQYLSNNPVIRQELKQSLLGLIQKSPSNFTGELKNNLRELRPVEITQTRRFRNEYLTQVLSECQLFSQAPKLKLTDFELVNFAHQDKIIQEGDEPDYFYILKSGKCDVYKGNYKINVIEQDQYFGELAFLFNTVRQATVIASGDVVVYRLDKDKIKL